MIFCCVVGDCFVVVIGAFCEVAELSGDVVKLSFEILVGVVEVIHGVVLICCVFKICSSVVVIPGGVIFCTGIS